MRNFRGRQACLAAIVVSLVGCSDGHISPSRADTVEICPNRLSQLLSSVESVAKSYGLNRVEGMSPAENRIVFFARPGDDDPAVLIVAGSTYLSYQLYERPFRDRSKYDEFARQFQGTLAAAADCHSQVAMR